MLGIATMGIAVVRRLLDSRAYARVYVTLGEEMAASAAGSSTSTRTARLGMLKEIVEFFENSLPQLINSVIGLGGTVLILAALNLPVFLGCLVVAVGTVVLYALTGGLTTRYNQGLNDEHERQVDAVDSGDPARLGKHLRAMMRLEHPALGPRSRQLRDQLGLHDRPAGLRCKRGDEGDGGIRHGLRRSHVRLPVRRIDADAAVFLPGVVAAARDLGEAGRGRGGGLTPPGQRVQAV